MKRILVLCTGNTCRSQMAEGLLKQNYDYEVFSAGVESESEVNPFAVKVMKEIGINISNQVPKDVFRFIDQSFDLVLTVCDHANETCPVFMGDVKKRVHKSFPDPAKFNGSDDQKLRVYKKVRDQLKDYIDNVINKKDFWYDSNQDDIVHSDK